MQILVHSGGSFARIRLPLDLRFVLFSYFLNINSLINVFFQAALGKGVGRNLVSPSLVAFMGETSHAEVNRRLPLIRILPQTKVVLPPTRTQFHKLQLALVSRH